MTYQTADHLLQGNIRQYGKPDELVVMLYEGAIRF